uniref:Uncharacterized protein n=1 Tax=Anguilla anguilla TaxID=7936 RepID=A0A0E9RCP4_ANGAN
MLNDSTVIVTHETGNLFFIVCGLQKNASELN